MKLRNVATALAATCAAGFLAPLIGTTAANAVVAPAPVIGLLQGNSLVSFNASTPGTIDQTTAVTGTIAGEVLVGFDVRPANGELVAVGVAGTSGHVYVVDALSGVARPVSPTAFSSALPAGGTWAVDFNPTVDRIRLVHSSGANYRLNPNNGALAATDTSLAPSQPTAVAYDRSTPTTPTSTTLFAIDPAASTLNLIGGVNGTPSPNGGATSVRGSLGVTVSSSNIGFDIAADGGAIATLQVGGSYGLYEIDLASGAASLIGAVGPGSAAVLDIAAQRPATGAWIALSDANSIVRFDAATPGTLSQTVAVTGLQPGESIVGLDVRPATGELIGVGVAGTTGRLYRVDGVTGQATALAATPFSTTLPSGGRWSVDFNPSVDRVRFVHSTGTNLRLNPTNGALAGTDTNVSPAQIAAVAYDRSVATSTVTTLFAIDSGAATLELIGGVNGTPSPNGGATTSRGALGVTPDDGDVGFDISSIGEALAAMRVGGSTGLYRVDLASGAAALVGLLGTGSLDVIDVAALPKLPVGAGQFTATPSTRLIDTRLTGTKPGAGQTLDLVVTGTAGVPSNATAVVVNLTATEANGTGFLTIYPTGEARPTTSNNNFVAGGAKANLVAAKIGTSGSISVFVDGGAHVIVDIVGYYAAPTSAAGRFTAMPGNRVLDTRSTTPVAAGGTVDVAVAGTQGVPATGVSAVMVNLTLTRATNPGYAVAYATGQPRPATSNVNVGRADGTASNLAVVPVGADGKISVYSEAGADIIVDVAGWFSDATSKGGYAGLFVPVTPSRVLDTRNGIGATAAALPPQGSVSVAIAGAAGVPAAGVSSAAITVTAVETVGVGFLTVFPAATMWPLASNVNSDAPASTVANLVVTPLGGNGQVTVFDDAGGHVLIDVAGWFTS